MPYVEIVRFVRPSAVIPDADPPVISCVVRGVEIVRMERAVSDMGIIEQEMSAVDRTVPCVDCEVTISC